MPTSERPWLQQQAHALRGTAIHAPPPPARALRRTRNAARYARVFVGVVVRDPGLLWRRTERVILWGKVRRAIIGCIPGLAARLKRKHGLTGGCVSCGTSCNLLFKCPHWDDQSRLCSIYADRPVTCRQFPITPADLKDRDLASGGKPCGYSFAVKVPLSARVRSSDTA
jgi:hypothetical protein